MSSQRWMREDFRLDVECRLCGYAGPADGWEDREVSKWGWDCPGCDYPHSHYIDDGGAVSVLAVTLLTGFFIGAALVLWGVLGHSWAVALTGGWLVLGILLYAALFGGNNERQSNDG